MERGGSAQPSSVHLAFVSCIINNRAYEMPTDSSALGSTQAPPSLVTVMERKHLFRSHPDDGRQFSCINSVVSMGRVLFASTAIDFSAIRTAQLAMLLLCHLLMA